MINSQKFIWETYKILLDFTKTNSKLLPLYAQILKSAFTFCKENRRKVEFKRLCDSVRGYLQTLIKTEKNRFFQNKVQISRPEVLKILIQIRINLLDTATELEQWQEAFKTAEDVIFLMDKYEKGIEEMDRRQNINVVTASVKAPKIPAIMKLEFYSNIEKLLWISDYPLYHAHATIMIKDLAQKAQKLAKVNEKNPEKAKDTSQRLEKFNIENINNKIILSALATPYKNQYTNYLKTGDELFEYEKDIDVETCTRMMGILKLSAVPSRKGLINYIENNKLLENADENIKELFYLLENETNPLTISKKGSSILAYIKNSGKFNKFTTLLTKNLMIRSLIYMQKLYDSITFQRIEKIFSFSNLQDIEEIISESSRVGIITCLIDHTANLIRFKNQESVKMSLNEKLKEFVFSVQKIGADIILSSASNKKKLGVIRNALYTELSSLNSNSLGIYDALVNQMETNSKKLKEFIETKESKKAELKEQKVKEKADKKKKIQEEAQLLQELARDEQKQKELDIQLKKYLIERIKIFTNVVVIDGKKIKLEEISKDLSKIKDEQLVKILEDEEINFKTKKEKRFKEIARNTDYTIREFRRRDFDAITKKLAEEENNLNKTIEEESKKSYEEKIQVKSILLETKPYTDSFFDNISKQREEEYSTKMNEFTETLNKKVKEDLHKELSAYFKIYIEDFRKRQEEDAKKMKGQSSVWGQQKRPDAWVKGSQFKEGTRFDDNRSRPYMGEFASKRILF